MRYKVEGDFSKIKTVELNLDSSDEVLIKGLMESLKNLPSKALFIGLSGYNKAEFYLANGEKCEYAHPFQIEVYLDGIIVEGYVEDEKGSIRSEKINPWNRERLDYAGLEGQDLINSSQKLSVKQKFKALFMEAEASLSKRDRFDRVMSILSGDDVIFDKPRGGIQRFEGLSYQKFLELFESGLLDPEELYNNSPEVFDLFALVHRYQDITAHGYVVDHSRSDYRITIEGLEFKGKVSPQMESDFILVCSSADDLDLSHNSLFCWWD